MQHAEIAQNNLDWVENHNPGFAQADIAVKAAQVHATLALVEQQRIANLITMFQLSDADASNFIDQGFNFTQAAVEIKTGLGL